MVLNKVEILVFICGIIFFVMNFLPFVFPTSALLNKYFTGNIVHNLVSLVIMVLLFIHAFKSISNNRLITTEKASPWKVWFLIAYPLTALIYLGTYMKKGNLKDSQQPFKSE